MKRDTGMCALLCVLWALFSPDLLIGQQGDKDLFSAVTRYEYGQSRKILDAVGKVIHNAAPSPRQRKDIEKRLIRILTSSATKDCKAFICRQLYFIGGAASVPVLAELLGDRDLSHAARYALEANPTDEALSALRSALR